MTTTPDHYSQDHAAKLVGVELQEVHTGYARATLQIRPTHINGLGMAHGGIVFLLADTVFAYACNARGVQTVAASCNITFHLPSRLDDVLTAVAEEHYLKGRSGIYDVTITNQHEQIVAHFRGNSIALKSS